MSPDDGRESPPPNRVRTAPIKNRYKVKYRHGQRRPDLPKLSRRNQQDQPVKTAFEKKLELLIGQGHSAGQGAWALHKCHQNLHLAQSWLSHQPGPSTNKGGRGVPQESTETVVSVADLVWHHPFSQHMVGNTKYNERRTQSQTRTQFIPRTTTGDMLNGRYLPQWVMPDDHLKDEPDCAPAAPTIVNHDLGAIIKSMTPPPVGHPNPALREKLLQRFTDMDSKIGTKRARLNWSIQMDTVSNNTQNVPLMITEQRQTAVLHDLKPFLATQAKQETSPVTGPQANTKENQLNGTQFDGEPLDDQQQEWQLQPKENVSDSERDSECSQENDIKQEVVLDSGESAVADDDEGQAEAVRERAVLCLVCAVNVRSVLIKRCRCLVLCDACTRQGLQGALTHPCPLCHKWFNKLTDLMFDVKLQ